MSTNKTVDIRASRFAAGPVVAFMAFASAAMLLAFRQVKANANFSDSSLLFQLAWHIAEAWVLLLGAYCLYRIVLGFRKGRVHHALLILALGIVAGLLALSAPSIPAGIYAVSGLSALAFVVVFKRELLDPFATPFEDASELPRPGEWIVIRGADFEERGEGFVLDVTARDTNLVDKNGEQLTIPNHILRRSVVTVSGSHRGLCPFRTSITLDASIPMERALRVLEAGAIAATREGGPAPLPPPRVSVGDAAGNSITYHVEYHLAPQTTPQAAAHAALMRSMVEHLQFAGLRLAMGEMEEGAANASQRLIDLRSLEGRIETLSNIELFEGLDIDALTEIAGRMKTMLYKKGQWVMREGDTGNSMFVLVEGLLQVYKRGPDGEQAVPVSRLNPLYFFGEMSLLTGQPRSATVIAETDAVAWEIRREDISGLLVRRPEISLKIGMVAAERRMKNVVEMGQYKPQDLQRQTARMVSHILAEMRAFFGAANAA